MAFAGIYRRQADLLIRTIPLVAEEQSFALKGGTAINLFVREMPRLSIDIDLTYLPIESRPQSLANIDAAMMRIARRIPDAIRGTTIIQDRLEGSLTKLFIRADGVQIKIEITPVLRGCVYKPELRAVSKAVENAFGFAEIQVVSMPDLYGGKFVAALDRQHPRDLFDVRDQLANEGIDEPLRKAFVVYMLSHNRPMSEVLAPTRKDISEEFVRGFEGMTKKPVSRGELVAAREALNADIVGKMPASHRKFLISFERGEPDWSLLGVPGAPELPAVKWRQQNLDKLAKEKRAELVARLEEVLNS